MIGGMGNERNGFFSRHQLTSAIALILEGAGVAMVIFFDRYVGDAGMLILGLGVIVGTIPRWRER
jgi:hypothetical protein